MCVHVYTHCRTFRAFCVRVRSGASLREVQGEAPITRLTMEVGRAGHSGLYTMHFSNLFPPEPSPAHATTATTSTTTAPVSSSSSAEDANGTAAAAAATSSPLSSSQAQHDQKQQQQQVLLQPYSLMQFTQWHILIRMNVENDICFVKGEAKVFSPTPSLASPVARGLRCNGEIVPSTTEPDGIPMVPVHQRDRYCHVLIEGNYRAATSSSDSSIQGSNGGAEGVVTHIMRAITTAMLATIITVMRAILTTTPLDYVIAMAPVGRVRQRPPPPPRPSPGCPPFA